MAQPMMNSGVQSRDGHTDCQTCPARHTSYCSVVPSQDLDALGHLRRSIRFERKQSIVCARDPALSFFNVVSGTVKLIRTAPDGRAQIVGFRSQGEFFATRSSASCAITAEAVTAVELCVLSRSSFKQVSAQWPQAVERLFELSCAQLEASEDQMFLLGRKTAREKVVSFLLAYANRTGADETGSLRCVNLPMTRADIADFLGLTTETVSRVFSSLAREKLISVGVSRSVHFHNVPELSRMTGT